jgi:hypothetical protein
VSAWAHAVSAMARGAVSKARTAASDRIIGVSPAAVAE